MSLCCVLCMCVVRKRERKSWRIVTRSWYEDTSPPPSSKNPSSSNQRSLSCLTLSLLYCILSVREELLELVTGITLTHVFLSKLSIVVWFICCPCEVSTLFFVLFLFFSHKHRTQHTNFLHHTISPSQFLMNFLCATFPHKHTTIPQHIRNLETSHGRRFLSPREARTYFHLPLLGLLPHVSNDDAGLCHCLG